MNGVSMIAGLGSIQPIRFAGRDSVPAKLYDNRGKGYTTEAQARQAVPLISTEAYLFLVSQCHTNPSLNTRYIAIASNPGSRDMGDPDIQEALPAGMVALRLEKYSEHTGKWYQLEPIVQYRGIKT